MIQVQLGTDLVASVRNILETNNFSVDSLDELINHQKKVGQGQPDRPINWIHSHYFAATGRDFPFTDIWDEVEKLKPAVTLK